ncbi:MAG: signal peptidase II [Verrucomicrobia bacterium]|nr:signal peptidase II [Verrucomicrobiota bacterium]
MQVLWLAFAVVFLDQAVKEVVLRQMALGSSIVVCGGLFDLRYVQNTGAAWGILEGFNGMLVLLSVAVLAAMVIFRKHFLADTFLSRLTLALMVGGIAGNLMDRLKHGYVVDYLDFYHGQAHFPAFNIADSAICIGVGLYIISQVLAGRSSSGSGGRAGAGDDHAVPKQVSNDA